MQFETHPVPLVPPPTVTVTFLESEVLLESIQVKVKIVVVEMLFIIVVPEIFGVFEPAHPEFEGLLDAEQEFVNVEPQDNVALPPEEIVLVEEVMETVWPAPEPINVISELEVADAPAEILEQTRVIFVFAVIELIIKPVELAESTWLFHKVPDL